MSRKDDTSIRSAFLAINNFLYYRSPNLFSNQLKSIKYRSRKDNTTIRSGFLVIRQLPCIFAYLKIIANQLKSM